MMKREKSSVDIEARPRRTSAAAGESDGGSVCFSDAEDRSWHSPYNSNRNGSSYDEFRCSGESSEEIGGVGELCGSSSCTSDCSFEVVDLEVGNGSPDGGKLNLNRNEKDCRICHLGLESSAPESGIAIVLGCSCKDDLAAAHKQCADTWFKIRGNKTCEICGSTAKNIVGAGETELVEHSNEASSNVAAPAQPTETWSFWLNPWRKSQGPLLHSKTVFYSPLILTQR